MDCECTQVVLLHLVFGVGGFMQICLAQTRKVVEHNFCFLKSDRFICTCHCFGVSRTRVKCVSSVKPSWTTSADSL